MKEIIEKLPYLHKRDGYHCQVLFYSILYVIYVYIQLRSWSCIQIIFQLNSSQLYDCEYCFRYHKNVLFLMNYFSFQLYAVTIFYSSIFRGFAFLLSVLRYGLSLQICFHIKSKAISLFDFETAIDKCLHSLVFR